MIGQKGLKMESKKVSIYLATCALCLVAVLPGRAVPQDPSGESAVRGVVNAIFEQLKAGRYVELYDALPVASRSRISRERFADLLRRASGTYRLDRLEVGAVRVSGDISVVDTVMYGTVERPFPAEGKIVAQQYLVREEGRWRVATGDRATIRRFLAANPAFAKKFPIREPRVFVKRDGRWLDLTQAIRASTKRG